MQYIVLWKNNGRVGSVELTPENLTQLKQEFCLMLIQTDATGTQHYDVLARYKKRAIPSPIPPFPPSPPHPRPKKIQDRP